MSNFSFSGDAGSTQNRNIPINIVQSGLLSKTSEAFECFVNQQFSLELQTFLINYNQSISSYYSLHV